MPEEFPPQPPAYVPPPAPASGGLPPNTAAALAYITIIPAIIFNSRKIMPPTAGFYFKPHRLAFHFLDPVTPQPGESVESLKQRVFILMQDYYLHPPQKV